MGKGPGGRIMRIEAHLPNNASTGAVSQASAGRAAARGVPRLPSVHPAGIAAERTVGDALAIARMSQSVIQRAVSIALRLKSIAANAIATGDVDRRALAETVSEIGSALGGRVTGVPPAPAPPPGNAAAPSMGEELGMLRDAAAEIERVRAPQPGVIDGALRKLDETINAYTRRSIDLMEAMQGTAPAAAGETALPAALAQRAGAAIESDPAAALNAQGNLAPAAVGRLTA